eukprot:1160855-Pelagomonas_calceolata.AAC.7
MQLMKVQIRDGYSPVWQNKFANSYRKFKVQRTVQAHVCKLPIACRWGAEKEVPGPNLPYHFSQLGPNLPAPRLYPLASLDGKG